MPPDDPPLHDHGLEPAADMEHAEDLEDPHEGLNRLAIGLALVVLILLALGGWHNRRRSRQRRRVRLREELERLERQDAPVRERAFLITELRALGAGSAAEQQRLDRLEAELDREVRRDRLTRRLDSELAALRAVPDPARRAERLTALLKVAGDIPKVALAVARELDDAALALAIAGRPSRQQEEALRALLVRTPGGSASLTAALRGWAGEEAGTPPSGEGALGHGQSALRDALLAEQAGDLCAAAEALPSIAEGLTLHETYALARLTLDVGRPMEALALAESLAVRGGAETEDAPGEILAAIIRLEARCDLGEPETATPAAARLQGQPFGDARAALARSCLLRLDLEGLERITRAAGTGRDRSGPAPSPTAKDPDVGRDAGSDRKDDRKDDHKDEAGADAKTTEASAVEPAGVALARGRLERLYRADDRAMAAFDHALATGSTRLRLEAGLRKAVLMARAKRERAAGEMLAGLNIRRPGDSRLTQLTAELALRGDRLQVAESILQQARRAGESDEGLELVVLRVRWRRLRKMRVGYRAEAWDAIYRELRELSGRCLHRPALADVFGLLGFLEERRGDSRAAERNYTTALRLAGPPGDPAILRWDDRLQPPRRAPWRAYRGFLLESSFGKPAAAIDDFEAFQRLMPGPSKLGERVAAALMRCRRTLAEKRGQGGAGREREGQ